MSRTTVLWSQCHFQEPKYVVLRAAERTRFQPGAEIEMEFTGQDPREGFAMARRAAQVYAGLLSPTGMMATLPYVSRLGPYQGHVVGSQSVDGKQYWRIDWNPRTNEFHINWRDERLDKSGRNDRSRHIYGANYVTGAAQDLFWEVESHFPGRVERRR